ncbi:serine/threonine-protein kinase [Salinactinospora qingdaonensis]|uniref:Protein kinase domain-containing protein n=1 Tax=Salinactinospora qingdaonensis TaxID=702744 RepID=A0ABP7GD02_9ACTN
MTESVNTRLAPLTTDDPAQIGAFQLIGRLGAGGMGVVYYGRDSSGYPAAVKMVRPEYAADPGYRGRFEREVGLAKRVRGRCIAPLLAADPHTEQPWLAIAYVSGPTLREHIASAGPLAGGHLTAFATGLAEALAAIHREGIVHRDLKPDNVILSPEGPKVLDFGIAQALDEASMTRSDIVVGTPGWISPERYDGHRAGPESDMFCWAELVAFAGSGRQPYGSGPLETLRYRTINEEPDSAADKLPPALHEVVQRALNRAPGQRPTAAEAFAAITGQRVDDSGEELTRVATQLIDNQWTLALSEHSTPLPSQPLRATTVGRPITFAGHTVHESAELAALFATYPDRAEEWLCGSGAARLRDWLDDTGDTSYDRDYLSAIEGPESAALAITAFAAAHAPTSTPTYRGHDVSIEGMRRLAAGGSREHQVLSEIIVNEVPLIAAAHACSHADCGSRCARLERIGHHARETIDAALLHAARLGFRLAPSERDRAVAIGIEILDEPQRRHVHSVVLPNVRSLAVPWWNTLAREALSGDLTTVEGRARVLALRLLTPFARQNAGPAWRRLLSPRGWVARGIPRVLLLSLLCFALLGFAAGGAVSSIYPSHPLALGEGADFSAPVIAGVLAYQMELWPFYALLAVGVVSVPARLRVAAVCYAMPLVLLATAVVAFLPRLPLLMPLGSLAMRDPVLGWVTSTGDQAIFLVVLAGVLGFLLFAALVGSAVATPGPVPPPLLPKRGALTRALVAIPLLGLLVWIPLWSVLLLLAVGDNALQEMTDVAVRNVFASFTSVVLPLAMVVGALAYLLWRGPGGHVLYLGFFALLFSYNTLIDSTGEMPAALPGAGALSLGLIETYGGALGWAVLWVFLPGNFVVGAWLAERLRYRKRRRPAPAPPGGYPTVGYATPPPVAPPPGQPHPGYAPQPGGHAPPRAMPAPPPPYQPPRR